MTFINQINRLAPLAVLSGASGLNANGGFAAHFRARLSGTSSLFTISSNAISSRAILAGFSSFSAVGRTGADDANRFGRATLTGASLLHPAAALIRSAVAVFGGESLLVARARVNQSERSTLNLFLTIAPDFVARLARVASARVAISGGADIPIKSFSYNETSGVAGIDAGFTLARPRDRAAVEAAAAYNFDIYDGDAWVSMFAGGRRIQNDFSFAFNDSRPSDSATFSTAAPVAQKFELAPVSNLTIYDGARLTLNEGDFETLFDTDGNPYFQQLEQKAGLTIYDLLQSVLVNKCGFAGFRTNLPNWNVRRADFPMSQSYLDGIAGHIGMFNPLFFVANNVVWILDATGSLPSGFAAPTPLDASRYKSAQLSQTNEKVDGFTMSYSTDETAYDYTTEIVETDAVDTTGNPFSPAYAETHRFRRIRNYFKYSQPLAPVRTETLSETTTVKAMSPGLRDINTETEKFFYDSFNNLKRIEKEIFALIPDLTNADFLPVWTRIKDVVSRFYYRPDITDPRRQILWRSNELTTGLIGIDTENKALNQDFKQDFSEANRAGNLKDGMTTEYGAIKSVNETIRQSKSGQLKYKVQTTDFLTTPPSVNNSTTDARAGDVSLNALTATQKQIVVLAPGAIRSNAKLQSLSVAELPLIFAVPLARRRLANRTKRSGSITLIGFDLTLRRGAMVNLFDRDGFQVGTFLIEGFKITGQNLGTAAQVTEQVLEVREVAAVIA